MVEKKGDGTVDRLGIDNVKVVEDEGEVILNRIDFIDQGRQDGLDRWRLRQMQQRARVLANTGPRGLQCGDQVGPEEAGGVVALIE